MRQIPFFRSLIFSYFVLLLCFGNVTAATLHAIIVADTLDEKSGTSAKQDEENFTRMLEVVAEATQLKFEKHPVDGESISQQGDGYEKVTSTINELSPDPDDVVVFYYAGHGVKDDEGSQWPKLELQGLGSDQLGTEYEKLLRLDSVKTTLEQKSPRLLIVMADTCNKTDVSRGRGEIILDKLSPDTEKAYKSLFLNYKGYLIASASKSGQKAYSSGEGGFFTRGFLTNFKEEVESSDEPSWKNIMDKTVEWVQTEVNREYGKEQVPQYDDSHLEKIAGDIEESSSSNENEISTGNPSTIQFQNTASCLTPDIFRPGDEESSSHGACYWEDKPSDWSVFAEEKLWFNTWTGWYQQSSEQGAGHFIAATANNEVSHLITLGARYENLTLTFSTLPSHSYDFPKISQPYYYQSQDKDGNKIKNYYEYQYESSADRQERDVSLSYAFMPELSIGVGFKHIEQKYHFYNQISLYPETTINWGNYDMTYKIYGPTLVVGSQVCLANLAGNNISLFGNFSYGVLKTKWPNGYTDPTRYHSADLGVSFKLPKVQQLKSEMRFGYRTQTIYTETNLGDGLDTTEGFTLGIRITF